MASCLAAFAAPGIASAKEPAPRLSAFFDPRLLDAQVPYLEHIFGPAKYVDGPTRIYVVQDCNVFVTTTNNKVRVLGLSWITPKCTVSLADFGFDKPLTKATFGMFQSLEGRLMHYTADCVYLCGNDADPQMCLTGQGTHAIGFMGFRVSVSSAERPAQAAFEKWSDTMQSTEGEDWLFEKKYKTTDKYDALATRLFRDVPIRSVEVGYIDDPNEC